MFKANLTIQCLITKNLLKFRIFANTLFRKAVEADSFSLPEGGKTGKGRGNVQNKKCARAFYA